LNTELELSISKLMFFSASVTGGGLEPKNFLIIASCIGNISVCILYLLKRNSCYYTGHTQKNGAVSKVNKKCMSHITRAQRTPSAAATVQVSHALPPVRR
jgi:hypothetical protein